MDKWLYIHIFDGNKQVLMHCIKETNMNRSDFEQLAEFLEYYGQRYKVRSSIFVEGVDHDCENVKCIRRHVIDYNVSKK